MLKRITLGIMMLGLVVATTGCETTPAQDGAILGTALGAGLGAIVGHQSGNQGEGALIGAGAGALTGALIGDGVRRDRERRGYQAQPAPQYQAPRQQAPATTRQEGHYEIRVVKTPNGETYEERVWVPHY